MNGLLDQSTVYPPNGGYAPHVTPPTQQQQQQVSGTTYPTNGGYAPEATPPTQQPTSQPSAQPTTQPSAQPEPESWRTRFQGLLGQFKRRVDHADNYFNKQGGLDFNRTGYVEQTQAQPQTQSQDTGQPGGNYTGGTVAQGLMALTSQDHPLAKAAETRALQSMNERGLLNSSLAVGAAEQARLDSMLPIAQQDASAQQALQNIGIQYGYQAQQQALSNMTAIQATTNQAITAIQNNLDMTPEQRGVAIQELLQIQQAQTNFLFSASGIAQTQFTFPSLGQSTLDETANG